MLNCYRRGARQVVAIFFDGCAATAAEISQRFSGVVVLDDGHLEIRTGYGRVFASMGCWIARDCRDRTLAVIDDREFETHFERVDDPKPLDRRSFARSPEFRAWDVAQ